MTRLDVMHKKHRSAVYVGRHRMERLDDELRRERQKRHIMSRSEFRERLMRDLEAEK